MRRLREDMYPSPSLAPGEVYILKLRNKKTGWIAGEWGSMKELMAYVGPKLCVNTWDIVPVVRKKKHGKPDSSRSG